MDIAFSDHAKLKINQRQINKVLVVRVVTDPDFERPSYGSRIELYKNFGKNYLKVVVRKELQATVVITAHWIAKIKNKE